MEDRLKELEARLQRTEEALAQLTRRLTVNPEDGVSVSAPFRVVDSQGKAMLDVDLGKNGPSLRLLNAEGKTALVLDIISTGGSFSICTSAGKTAALLFADELGGDFVLYDQDGKVQSSLP